jgi:hypothetical protein
VAIRRSLREESVLGEYGARAIQAALKAERARVKPSLATINRVLSRRGPQDAVRRIRRPALPQGWYLPEVAAGRAEVDCFDFVEGLKIADGPLVDLLTAKSSTGRSPMPGRLSHRSAKHTVLWLRRRWKRDELPDYGQFDNDTVFQGAHQFANAVGRISRLCLQLAVIPVFVPPLEHGMQNTIESFDGLWQAKVWQRYRMRSVCELQRRSDEYIAARRLRTQALAEAAPRRRPVPKCFKLNLNGPLRGLMIFIRRIDETGLIDTLGQRLAVSPNWSRRLVRREVDFDHHYIRFFDLRRRAPNEQPPLATIAYHRPDKPFQGEL